MKYIDRVRQPGETVVHIARLHWLIFVTAIVRGTVAAGLLIGGWFAAGDLRTILTIVGAAAGLYAVAAAVRAIILRITTELAVTDRRVIYKSGLISRHTLEMNRSKVESVDVDQSIWGRLLGFGTIIVRGTGGSLEPIRMVHDPLTFRSHITAG
jgi:uncharacterized membrane protein YdbT with pleckstrin-like domain